MSLVSRKCTVFECHDNIYSRGYCNKHYKKLLLYGDANKIIWDQAHGQAMPQHIRLKIRDANTGHQHSHDTKNKLSMALMGHAVLESTKNKLRIASLRLGLKPPSRWGCEPWNKGRTSKAVTSIKQLRHSPKYKVWRESVFKRDSYICKVCGNSSNHLRAHHRKSFSEQVNSLLASGLNYDDILKFDPLWSLCQGITLCHSCHTGVRGVHPNNNTHLNNKCPSPPDVATFQSMDFEYLYRNNRIDALGKEV